MHVVLRFYFFVFTIFNDQFEKLYQTNEREREYYIRIPNTSNFVQKNSTACRFVNLFFNSFLGVRNAEMLL